MTNQNTKPADKAPRQPDPKTQKIGDKTGYAQTDEDVNNPQGGVPKPLSPNDPEPVQESWAAKQARHARENERAEGAGLPPVHPHD